jgi:hypothetical protein
VLRRSSGLLAVKPDFWDDRRLDLGRSSRKIDRCLDLVGSIGLDRGNRQSAPDLNPGLIAQVH